MLITIWCLQAYYFIQNCQTINTPDNYKTSKLNILLTVNLHITWAEDWQHNIVCEFAQKFA